MSGNTPITSCTPANATSCTLLATPTLGNMLISMAYRSNSATAPTTAAGWTVLKTTTGNVNSIKLAWKFAVGNETTCGTWTNATQTYCEVYGGNWITGGTLGGTFGNNASGTTGSSTSISYPTFTLTNPLSTSWVLCAAGGASATNVDAAPSGMTLRSGTTLNNIAFSDTNGNVTTWPTTAVTVAPTGVWATACAELVGTPAVSDINSNLVFSGHYSVSLEPCTGVCDLTVPVSSSLANNFLHLNFAWTYASVAPTVSNIYCNNDTGHATWTWALNKSILDTTNTTDVFDYSIANAAAGCTSVTVVASSVWTLAEAAYQEFYHIAASNPVESAVGQSIATAYPTAGALTPISSGDVIVQHCTQASIAGNSNTNIFTSGGTATLAAEPANNLSTIGFVQTGTTSLSPSVFTAGVTTYDCTAVALKVDNSAGTAPSGVHVVQYQTQHTGSGATLPYQLRNINSGDALLLVGNNTLAGTAKQWTGITDTLGDTFTSHQPTDANGGYPNFALDCAIASGENQATFTGSPGGGTFFFLEIAGLINSSHTACYDSTAGTPVFSGSTTAFSPAPTITPSTATGIVISSSETSVGPGNAVTSPAGAAYFVPFYTGMTDASSMGAGNFFGLKSNTSTASQTWTYTGAPGSAAGWNASAIALMAPASGSSAVEELYAGFPTGKFEEWLVSVWG